MADPLLVKPRLTTPRHELWGDALHKLHRMSTRRAVGRTGIILVCCGANTGVSLTVAVVSGMPLFGASDQRQCIFDLDDASTLATRRHLAHRLRSQCDQRIDDIIAYDTNHLAPWIVFHFPLLRSPVSGHRPPHPCSLVYLEFLRWTM